jgi:uncharacterized protein YdhG (YjbR/CyaY superfamily)
VRKRDQKPTTIAEYIDATPAPARKKLREMRAAIRKAAPDAVEGIKWSMPAFSDKRILVMFAAFRHHIGFFPTASAVKAFSNDLADFGTSKGTIRFPLDRPLPLPLIRKIVKFRVQESKEKDGKWKT